MDNMDGLVGHKDRVDEGGIGDGADEGGSRAGLDVDANRVVPEIRQGKHQGLAQVAG